MTTELFADTVRRVEFVGGVVRIELVSLDPGEDGGGAMAVRQRVIMPLEGFLRACEAMGGLVEKLAEAGLVQRNAPASVPTGGTGPKSPNFG